LHPALEVAHLEGLARRAAYRLRVIFRVLCYGARTTLASSLVLAGFLSILLNPLPIALARVVIRDFILPVCYRKIGVRAPAQAGAHYKGPPISAITMNDTPNPIRVASRNVNIAYLVPPLPLSGAGAPNLNVQLVNLPVAEDIEAVAT